jgi:hypothetical protein
MSSQPGTALGWAHKTEKSRERDNVTLLTTPPQTNVLQRLCPHLLQETRPSRFCRSLRSVKSIFRFHCFFFLFFYLRPRVHR